MFKHTLSLVASATLVASLGADTLALAPIAVTAGAYETNELNAPYAIEIYTKEDIQKVHAQNIYDFLNQSSSVITMPNYGNPFAQKLDFRGYGYENGYQNIVVLLNGRRLNNIDMAPQLLSSIPLNTIERIEITKGSGIVTAGDGANAGVINIITSTSGNNSVTLYGGTYGTRDGAFNLNKNTETLQFNLTGEAYRTNGIRRYDANGNKDEKSLFTGSFNLAYTPNNDLEIRLGGDFSEMDTIYPGPLTLVQYKDDPNQKGPYSTHQKFSTRSVSTGLTYGLSNNLTLNTDLFHEKKSSEYINSSSYFYTYNSAKVNLDYKNDNLTFRTGLDGFKGERESTLDFQKESIAAFATGAITLNKDSLEFGYRFEDVNFNNNKGWSKNEQLHGIDAGVNHLITSEQSVFFNYSHSYKTAEVDRLFHYLTGAFLGYVDPMKAHNFTLGYNFIQPHNKLKISAYYTDLKKEIYYYKDPVTSSNSKNTNLDKSHKYGIDLYDQWIINDQWNVLGTYNYVQAIIDEEIQNSQNYSTKKLPGVSNHNVKIALTYMPNQATAFSVTQIYRSEAYAANDFNNNFNQKQETYTSTNMGVTYTQKDYELFAKINNLFNQSNGIWIKDNAIYPVDFTTTAIAGVKFIF